nr:uncharacterized protein LOC105319030 isoform X1 [Crassostrea gigas]
MKRRHAFDEFCAEESIRVKRRKTRRGKKGGRRHCPRVSPAPSPDFQTGQSVCDATNLFQCNMDTVEKDRVARDHAIYQPINIVNESEKWNFAQDVSHVAGDTIAAQKSQQDFQIDIGTVRESDDSVVTLSQEDLLGVLQGLNSTYNLAETAPEDQPFQVVMDGSSMYLVGPQNQLYLSVGPQTGDAITPDSQLLCTIEPTTDQVCHSPDNLDYSHQYTTQSFSDKIKERLENWYYATMDIDRREAHLLKYPSHLLEWSERVKFSHTRKWKQLEFHAPDYSKFCS